MSMDPELAPIFNRIPRINPTSWIMRNMYGFLARVMPIKRAEGATLTKVRYGKLKARLHSPANRAGTAPRGALLWIHGGGYILGHPRQDDKICSEIAAELGLFVLAPQYRLAPRHKYPAALNDCREAWDWLLAQAASLGIDPARMAIGGDSAGGGLAASLVQSICDERPGTVAAQWLFEPMLDDRTSADGRDADLPEFTWKSAHNRFGWGAYIGKEPGAQIVPPYASAARYENLAALPKTWIGVGTLDLFLNECRAYANRLDQAGCEVELVCVPGAPHGFHSVAPLTSVTRNYKQSAMAWLNRAIGG